MEMASSFETLTKPTRTIEYVETLYKKIDEKDLLPINYDNMWFNIREKLDNFYYHFNGVLMEATDEELKDPYALMYKLYDVTGSLEDIIHYNYRINKPKKHICCKAMGSCYCTCKTYERDISEMAHNGITYDFQDNSEFVDEVNKYYEYVKHDIDHMSNGNRKTGLLSKRIQLLVELSRYVRLNQFNDNYVAGWKCNFQFDTIVPMCSYEEWHVTLAVMFKILNILKTYKPDTIIYNGECVVSPYSRYKLFKDYSGIELLSYAKLKCMCKTFRSYLFDNAPPNTNLEKITRWYALLNDPTDYISEQSIQHEAKAKFTPEINEPEKISRKIRFNGFVTVASSINIMFASIAAFIMLKRK